MTVHKYYCIMRILLFLSALGLSAMLVGCADKGKANGSETAGMKPVENVKVSDFAGVYKGTIPAADCPGINVSLSIGRDGKFERTEEYIGKDTFLIEGIYTIGGNVITTVSNTVVDTVHYRVENGALRMLDSDRKEVTGILADDYLLKLIEKG